MNKREAAAIRHAMGLIPVGAAPEAYLQLRDIIEPPKRKRIPAKRAKPRAGRVHDRIYLRWLAMQPPLVPGAGRLTIHHVRRYGEPKDDRRTVPLPASLHMRGDEVPGIPCVERGKAVFEKFHGVDLEAAILDYNARYAQEMEQGNGTR